MSCPICRRSACCRSFHSLEEQEEYSALDGLSENDLRQEVVSLRREIKSIEKANAEKLLEIRNLASNN